MDVTHSMALSSEREIFGTSHLVKMYLINMLAIFWAEAGAGENNSTHF